FCCARNLTEPRLDGGQPGTISELRRDPEGFEKFAVKVKDWLTKGGSGRGHEPPFVNQDGLSPLFDWNVFSHLRADVFGTRANQAVIGVLFKDVGRIASDATTSKDGRIQVNGKAQHVVNGGRIEIDITIKALLFFDIVLDNPRHLEPAAITGTFPQFFG